MRRPLITDTAGIIGSLRREGCVVWPLSQLPEDFVGWRREVRRAAKAADLRISVRQGERYVLVEHLEHELTEDEQLAMTDVLDATLRGKSLSFETALKARGRQRLRMVDP
jgi:hypothetical protein